MAKAKADEIYPASQSENRQRDALDVVREELASHCRLYYGQEGGYDLRGDCRGIWRDGEDWVGILPDVLRDVLEAADYDSESVISQWERDGTLLPGTNGRRKQARIGEKKIKVYAISASSLWPRDESRSNEQNDRLASKILTAIAEWLDSQRSSDFDERFPFVCDRKHPNCVIVQNKSLQQHWPLVVREDIVPTHVALSDALKVIARKGRERLTLDVYDSNLTPIRVWGYAVPLSAIAKYRRAPLPRPQDSDHTNVERVRVRGNCVTVDLVEGDKPWRVRFTGVASDGTEGRVLTAYLERSSDADACGFMVGIMADMYEDLDQQHRYRIEDLEAENEELRRRLEEYELAEVTPADLAASLGVGAGAVEVQTAEEFSERLPPDPTPPKESRDSKPKEVSGAPAYKKPSKRPTIRTKPKGW